MYKEAEGDTKPYENITSEDDVWPLLKPREWEFETNTIEYTSQVIIDFGWPNPHFLVAYLTDTELYVLDVDG
jgi:hypothetical protein